MGKRSISQLRRLDFTMALSLGNIIAHPLSDEQLAYNVNVNDILLATIAITIILSFVQKCLN
jgi:uncharacterized membrane protein YcaP (DUF421 family)